MPRMALTTGTRLGPYEVLEMLGAGGMEEVYKAMDTRLNRTVAIKVLPPHFVDDPEMKQRFAREAQAIAGLNHPNICTLHDIGRHENIDLVTPRRYIFQNKVAAGIRLSESDQNCGFGIVHTGGRHRHRGNTDAVQR
jgi:serine/threonine protein kinase